MKAKVHVTTSTWKSAKLLGYYNHENMQIEREKIGDLEACPQKKSLRPHPLEHQKTPFCNTGYKLVYH